MCQMTNQAHFILLNSEIKHENVGKNGHSQQTCQHT
jgi:hypothetical protein